MESLYYISTIIIYLFLPFLKETGRIKSQTIYYDPLLRDYVLCEPFKMTKYEIFFFSLNLSLKKLYVECSRLNV